MRADDADQRLAEVIVVKATGTQESAMRRAIKAVDGDARAIAIEALGGNGYKPNP